MAIISDGKPATGPKQATTGTGGGRGSAAGVVADTLKETITIELPERSTEAINAAAAVIDGVSLDSLLLILSGVVILNIFLNRG